MNQSRNFTSLLNPSYLQNAQSSVPSSAAAAAAAAAAAVSAAIANGTALSGSLSSKKREAEGERLFSILLLSCPRQPGLTTLGGRPLIPTPVPVPHWPPRRSSLPWPYQLLGGFLAPWHLPSRSPSHHPCLSAPLATSFGFGLFTNRVKPATDPPLLPYFTTARCFLRSTPNS
jgi:hypothetical protein